MPRVLETRLWQRDSQAVIVGIHLRTRTVARIWILNDGGLLFRCLTHYPRQGRTAPGEALTTFGLVKFRRFSVPQCKKAIACATRLELALEPDDDEA